MEDKAVALNKAISSGKSLDNKWANWIMEGGGVRTSKGFPWLVVGDDAMGALYVAMCCGDAKEVARVEFPWLPPKWIWTGMAFYGIQ